jgi:hypothetical protein
VRFRYGKRLQALAFSTLSPECLVGIGCTLVARIVSSIFIAVHTLGRLDGESEVRGGAADALVERKQIDIGNGGSGEQSRG